MRLCRARKGLPYPLGVLLSKSLLQPQEPSRNRHDSRLKKPCKSPFRQFPTILEFSQYSQACGRLGWTQPYTYRMVSLSVNHFWAHRNPAGKPTPPQKCSFFMKRGVFSPMFSTTFLNNQSFSTIAAYAIM